MAKRCLINLALITLMVGCASDSGTETQPSDVDASIAQDAESTTDAATEPLDAAISSDGSIMQADAQVVTDAFVEPLEPIDITLAPEALKDAVCGFTERCDLLELFELVVNEPCGDFVQRQFEDGTLASLRGALESGEVIYNGEKMARCVADLNTTECTVDIAVLFTGCDNAFDGQIVEGADCAYNQVCQGDLVCIFGDACPGTCQPVPAAGEACTLNTGCGENLVCHQTTCVAPIGRGASCTENGPPCDAGLFCKANLFGGASCEALNTTPVGRGRTCDLNGGPFCTSGLSCVAELPSVVIPGLPVIPEFKCKEGVAATEPCFAGAPDQCPSGYFCDGFDLEDIENLDIEGECVALPNEGEPCAASLVGDVCNVNLVCSEGTCTARARLTEACSSDTACYSGHCNEAVCAVNQEPACR